MQRVIIIFIFLFSSVIFSQNIDLPSAEVKGNRIFSNTNEIKKDSFSSNTPSLNLFKDSNENVFIKPDIIKQEIIKKQKNAFFFMGYGLYDNLISNLLFGNSFNNLFYLVSFDRYSIDYFYYGNKKVLNSPISKDKFNLKMGLQNKKLKTFNWNTSLYYYKNLSGLQENVNFVNANKKVFRMKNLFYFKNSYSSKYSFLLNYKWATYDIAGPAIGIYNNFNHLTVGAKYESLWSESNSLFAFLTFDYKILDNLDNIKAFNLVLYDNFLILNKFNIKSSVNLCFLKKNFYFLPYLNFSFPISKNFLIRIYGGKKRIENSMDAFLEKYDYLYSFNRIYVPTISAHAGFGFDFLVLGFFSLSSDLKYISDVNMVYLTKNQFSLFEINYKNIDYIDYIIKLRLIKNKNFNFSIVYNYKLFESFIYYYPLNSINSMFSFKILEVRINSEFKYLTDIYTQTGYLDDSLLMNLKFQRILTKTITLKIDLENLLNSKILYYDGYKEPGFILNIGLKINLL